MDILNVMLLSDTTPQVSFVVLDLTFAGCSLINILERPGHVGLDLILMLT